MKYQGSCHCKAVKFTVEASENIDAIECNCSICAMTGFLRLIVPLSKFNLLSAKDKLQTYTFNTGVAKHFFCKVCGIKPFYIPRSNLDGMDISVNCLSTKANSLSITTFDGENWKDNASSLAHKSKET